MLYFFHHYELPAILQQAQIQQLGRVHTVNILLRNVPNVNNNNNQNATNNSANGVGENATDGGRENANNGAGGTRNAGVQRPNLPPMVNLVFRNMTGGLANNRNGNTSLSFVFRNVRNIVQNLQQNNAVSTSTSTSTTTTSPISVTATSVSGATTSTATAPGTLGAESIVVNATPSTANVATNSAPLAPVVTQSGSRILSNSTTLSSLVTPFTSASLPAPLVSSTHVTSISSPRQSLVTATSSLSSDTIDNDNIGSVISDTNLNSPLMSTSYSQDSFKASQPYGISSDSSKEASSTVTDPLCCSDFTNLNDGVPKDGARYRAIPVGEDVHKGFNSVSNDKAKCSADVTVASDTALVLSDTSEVTEEVDTNSIFPNIGSMPCGTARALDHSVKQSGELTNSDQQESEVCKSNDVAAEPKQPEQELRHRVTSVRYRHHRPHLDGESSG